MKDWLVMRYHVERDAWSEVGVTSSSDAGSAFRHLVLAGGGAVPPVGEYRVLQLEDGAHLAVELNLRDLDAAEKPGPQIVYRPTEVGPRPPMPTPEGR